MVISREEVGARVGGRVRSANKIEAELAGPPVGHLPAGIQSQYASSQTGHGTTTAGAGACSTVSYQGNGSWGDPANVPRVRYDGGVYFIRSFWIVRRQKLIPCVFY